MTEVGGRESYYVAETDETSGRLIRVSELLAQDVCDDVRRTDLRLGDTVLEVGCGPLGTLWELSVLVGPPGTVVDFDMDEVSLKRARAILDQAGRENVRLVHANINAEPSDELRQLGPFDAAYCRFLLMHQPDPADTLRRTAALLRPGGYMITHELSSLHRHPRSRRCWRSDSFAAGFGRLVSELGRRRTRPASSVPSVGGQACGKWASTCSVWCSAATPGKCSKPGGTPYKQADP
jgi:SAM-dependent methyltransferase